MQVKTAIQKGSMARIPVALAMASLPGMTVKFCCDFA
jgi:hypothetical protein